PGYVAEVGGPVGRGLGVPCEALAPRPELPWVVLDPVERGVAGLAQRRLVPRLPIRIEERVDPRQAVQVLAIGATPVGILLPVDRWLEPRLEVEDGELPPPRGLLLLARVLLLRDNPIWGTPCAVELAQGPALATPLRLAAPARLPLPPGLRPA